MKDAVELDEVKSRNIKGAKTTDLVIDKKATMMEGKEEPELILQTLVQTWNEFLVLPFTMSEVAM